eukprot:g24158.t1
MITEQGSWPYLGWNAKEKRLMPMDKSAISMQSMQSVIEELVELAAQGESILRFKLKRIGEARPGLATYLGWLGKFDPEALSILSTPTPTIAWAMKLQADAVWGTAGEDGKDGTIRENLEDFEHLLFDQTSGDEEGKEPTVASTPADMLEATLFGAWLHDAEANAQEVCSRLDCGAQG